MNSLKYLTSFKLFVKDKAKLFILFDLPICMASLSFSVRQSNLIDLFSMCIPLLFSKKPSSIAFANIILLLIFIILILKFSNPILKISFNFYFS